MIVKRFTLFALVAFFLGVSFFSFWETSEPTYFPRQTQFNSPSLANGYLEYIDMVKANRQTGTVDPNDVIRAKQHVDRMPSSKTALGINWTFKGPDDVGGRTRAIVIDRNNPNHLLAGGQGGGVYESFDGANSWQPYDPSFSVMGISCITQDAAGDFYIGTGGHFDALSGGGVANDDKNRGTKFIGSGVYKLTGNGNYELIVGPNPNFNTIALDWSTIGSIVADPNTPEKIYVAANHGFRVIEKQGGNWVDSDPIGYNAKCLDVEVSANGNALVTYRSLNNNDQARVYTSTDGMQNWTLSQFNAGRIDGVIAPSNQNVMYLSAAANSGCLHNIYRSRDAGATWDIIGPGGASSFQPFSNSITCQGYWDNLIAVSPSDAGKLFIGGITLWTWEQSSVDPAPANGSWRRIDVTIEFINGFLDPRYVHSDKHRMVFDPTDSNIAYITSDGGVAKSTNILDIQPTYLASNFNFNTSQYYNISVNSNDIVLGGTQDNGSHLIGLQYNSNKSGLEVQGGDGFGSELSSINPEIGVATLYFNFFRRIQGIGTTLGNTNISRADIISNNVFFGGLCSGNSCQGPFYSVVELWESFYHEGTRDVVEVRFDRGDLPPVPQDTIFEFEGNNNGYLQYDTLAADSFPYDTLVTWIDTLSLTYEAASDNRLVANFDTIVFDTVNRQIAVLRRNLPDTLINYSVNTTYAVANEVTTAVDTNVNANYDDIDTRIKVSANGESITVYEPRILFRYRFEFTDYVQSIFASANWPGLTGTINTNQRNIIITRDLLKNSPDMKWFNIAGPNSSPDPIDDFNTVLTMEFTRDGNHLFVGTSRGDVYRISDIDSVFFPEINASTGGNLYSIQNGILAGKCRKIGRFTGRAVTDISVDPNNPNHVAVALGNYGNTGFVARTTFALTATDPTSTFTLITGSGNTALPDVPAYSVLIDKNNPNRLILGTDLGIFATSNAFSAAPANVEWYEENIGIGRVPVYDLDQMIFDYNVASNDGKIYAGTHGRGVFETDQFVSVQNLDRKEETEVSFESGLKIYPNPVKDVAKVEFEMAERADVRIQVYSLNGRLVLDEQYANQSEGKNTIQINLDELSNGTYIIRAISGDKVASNKLLIYR
ncbi:MAG: hypothetical protein CMP59_03985 [Flavobacteriales bacterium]|nr:hypothetical protein [Flavobacteriales bacterium]